MEIKKFDELTFSDDFMFCKVLENNEDLCSEIIELILGKRIRIVKSIGKQKTIQITPDGKGIRLDVYMEDDDTIYDLEMQTVQRGDLPQRSRYYQAEMDGDLLDKGADYRTLKDSCIIFICTFDPFGYGYSKYVVKQVIAEHPELCYNDGTMKVFLSTKPGLRGEMSSELRQLLNYVNGDKPSGELSKKIDAAVQISRTQQNWRREYMFIEERYREFREEGLEQGLEQGRSQERLENIRTLIENTGWSAQEAMDKLGIPEDQREELTQSL